MSTILITIILFNDIFSQPYQLVWSDEFDSTSIDETNWEFQYGNGVGGWGNNELQYYLKSNTIVEDGSLKITAKNENYSGFEYTSSKISTRNKIDWKYGKFEIRAKMPLGKGLWPAFWMMPSDGVYGGWAASGEIDIMEYLGHEPNKVYGTLHYGDSWPNNIHSGKNYTMSGGNFNDDFHTFSIVWEENVFGWFVDGKLYQTQTSWYTQDTEFPAPFDQDFYIILNLAVGGDWPGSPDASTVFPQEFEIDYVRVYQKNITTVDDDKTIPSKFKLDQNYPNPFNPTTKISYMIPTAETGHAVALQTVITVYDLLGREVTTLVNKIQLPGKYEIEFNASDMPGGVYLYRLNYGSQSITKKMMILK